MESRTGMQIEERTMESDRTIALLNRWVAEEQSLTLVYTSPGCAVHEHGTLSKEVGDTFCFRSESESRFVILCPDSWVPGPSVESEVIGKSANGWFGLRVRDPNRGLLSVPTPPGSFLQ